MKKRFTIRYAVLITICIVVATICAILFTPESSSNVQLNSRITLGLGVGTFIALLWYTFETYRMQRAVTLQAIVAAEQIEISVMPRLVAKRQYGKTQSILQLYNVGNGVAVNVRIDPVVLEEQFGIGFEFEPILHITPGNSCDVRIFNLSGGKQTDFHFDAHLDQKYANRDIPITIRYDNLSGKSYQQTLQLGKNFPIIGTAEQLNS